MTFLQEECGFEANVKVSQFSKAFQAGFAKWSATKHQHSPAYVSRNLSVIAAASRFGSKTTLRTNSDGMMVESRLLRFMPEVCYDAKWLADIMGASEPKPRDYVPTFEELASLLDTEASDLLRRYDIIALNTWARPEAIVDLQLRGQVDFVAGLIDLNPAGRRQTKKRRPIIKLTENLRGWFECWGENKPLSYDAKSEADGDRKSASHIKGQFYRRSTKWILMRSGCSTDEIKILIKANREGAPEQLQAAIKAAESKGIRPITRYPLRHFMATKVRGPQEIKVDREQRSHWLGHGKRDATSWYESHDPEFLQDCAKATTLILEKLDALTERSLVPPEETNSQIPEVISSDVKKRVFDYKNFTL